MAVKKLEHVGIQVRDIDTSIEFYTRVVGLVFLEKQDHIDPKIKLAFLGFEDSKEPIVELISGYNPDLPAEGKVHHLAFAVDNIEAEIARVKELYVTFVDESITTLPSGSKYIFFYGPDGEWIEFFQS
ncbi:VOC family protein [Gottfriedia sp. NPDC056225]|uniref:VOC family protein n=1 Tax=Gottfriedia sp. NPDC056225 TaxID=3345751 RepID=UPI0035DEDA52